MFGKPPSYCCCLIILIDLAKVLLIIYGTTTNQIQFDSPIIYKKGIYVYIKEIYNISYNISIEVYTQSINSNDLLLLSDLGRYFFKLDCCSYDCGHDISYLQYSVTPTF